MNLTPRELERIAYASGDTATLRALELAETVADEIADERNDPEIDRLQGEVDQANREAHQFECELDEMCSFVSDLAEALEAVSAPISEIQAAELAALLTDFVDSKPDASSHAEPFSDRLKAVFAQATAA